MDLFEAQAAERSAQFLLHEGIDLAREAGMVGRKLRDVHGLSAGLLVHHVKSDLGRELRARLLLPAAKTGKPGIHQVSWQSTTCVRFHGPRRQVELHPGFLFASFPGAFDELRADLGDLEMLQYELIEQIHDISTVSVARQKYQLAADR